MLKFWKQICKPVQAAGIIGDIKPPSYIEQYNSTSGSGLIVLINNVLNLMVVGAGLFTLVNIILAGYNFITASSNAEQIEKAWAKVWQSVLGLVIVAGAFTISALIGKLVFNRWDAIINPEIKGPGGSSSF